MTIKSHLRGRILINCSVKALTGMHIGGSSTGLEIGGVDNTIIRDPLSGAPYIPGSSLRGKMRSQLEKTLGLKQNAHIGKDVAIHSCKTRDEYDAKGGCPVCHIFGVPGEAEASGPTLLIVRDIPMSEATKESLNRANTDLAYTELKTEVAIDRVTSAATPRTLERVPAGAVFSPAELVFSVYQDEDFARLRHVIDGLQLLEDDYLGGYGSRGSGKVKFQDLTVSVRFSETYGQLEKFKTFATLQELEASYDALMSWIKSIIKME